MPEIREFKVNVPQEKIDRLHRRLDDTEFPTELEDGPGWQYGSPMYSNYRWYNAIEEILTTVGRM